MTGEINIRNVAGRVEFWIILFFLVRLIGITNPPLEIGHSWRQVTGLMVARNFLEADANILYPRVDDNYGQAGIIGMEFPVMSYLHFLLAKILGYTHWYGRLINLIVSSLGLFFFAKIVNRFFSYRVALAAVVCLIGSAWFAYSRKTMPDTFSVSLMIIGLYASIRFLDKGSALSLVLYTFFASLAVLAKIPAGIYFAVIPLLFFWKKIPRQRLVLLGFATIIPLVLTFIWYFWWNPHLSEQFGIWYNSGKPFKIGYQEITSNLGSVLEKFYFNAFYSYVFFAAFIAGIIFMIIKSEKKLISIFIALLAVFLAFMFKSGFFFYHHGYYIIPFVPVMALVAGYAICQIRYSWAFVAILVLGVVESVVNQQHDFFIKPAEQYKMQLESIADSVSSKDDLVVINLGPSPAGIASTLYTLEGKNRMGLGNPQQLYLLHRKGWLCYNEDLKDPAFLNAVAEKGCKYVVVNRHFCAEELDMKVVFNNEDFIVYELKKSSQDDIP